MKELLALASTVLLCLTAAADEPFVLRDGTPIKLRINRTLSSADAKVGDGVDFEVLEDVKVGDVLVAPKGGVALATVTEAVSKRRMARGGKLNVNIDHLRLLNDQKVALRAVKEAKGGGHTGAMTGGIVATSIVFFPAAPFFLFMHGKDITIPKGTEITAYVEGDATLDKPKFVALNAPKESAASSPAVSGKALTNQDILALKEAGLSDDVIVAKVKSSPGDYTLDTADLIALKKAGIPDSVFQAMLAAKKK